MTDADDTGVLLIACPFEPCQARVELAHVRALSLDQPGYNMIKAHEVEPGSWYGTCPASLLTHPLMPHEQSLLAEQAAVYRTMDRGRERPAGDRPATESVPDDEAGDPEAPWRRARWFRNSEGPTHEHGPRYSGRPILTLIQPNDPPALPPSTPTAQGGGAMASVAEVRAALYAANTSIAEGQAAAQLALQRLTDARVQLTSVQGQTGRELSIPDVDNMIQTLEGVMAAASVAIEVNATFGASL